MPMPAHVQMRLIKESLTGKVGIERIRIIRRHLAQLPGYRSGPYAQVRAWLEAEIDRTRLRERSRHQESFMIAKEGHRQVALVGAPNAGKSALLHALSGLQLKVADYPHATLKPTAGLIWLNGAAVQLVEVPGIIPGAAEDRGGGRALLGAVRNADAVVLIASLREPVDALASVLAELPADVAAAPGFLCLTGLDLPGAADRVSAFAGAYDQWPLVACSTATGAGIDDVRAALWSMLGLIRIWPHTNATRSEEAQARRDGERPFVLEQGSSIRALARLIHKEMAGRLRGARVWGPSAKFDAQQVGPEHVLADGDTVELLLRG